MSKPIYYIKENSWIAYLATKKMKADTVALVLGKTIHLYGCSKSYFLADASWVRHELCHIKQFAAHGYFLFLCKYLWEWAKVGYYNNKYEVEARAAENN